MFKSQFLICPQCILASTVSTQYHPGCTLITHKNQEGRLKMIRSKVHHSPNPCPGSSVLRQFGSHQKVD